MQPFHPQQPTGSKVPSAPEDFSGGQPVPYQTSQPSPFGAPVDSSQPQYFQPGAPVGGVGSNAPPPRFCHQCGAALVLESRFCGQCGTPMVSASAPGVAPPVAVGMMPQQPGMGMMGQPIPVSNVQMMQPQGQVVHAGVGSMGAISPPRGNIRINVKTLTGKSIYVMVNKHTTVVELKMGVQEKEGISVDSQRLIFAGKQLGDHESLRHYGIRDGATVHLVLSRNKGSSGHHHGRRKKKNVCSLM